MSIELNDEIVDAWPLESIHEKHNTFKERTQSYETEELPGYICQVGKLFELTDDEIEEAKKAIASNQAAFEAQEAYMGHMFPLAGLSPHEEKRE